MNRCLKCQSTDIIPDYEIVPGLGRQMYLKCHMCGGRKIEDVDQSSISDQFAKKSNFEIFEKEDGRMSRATRYDQAFKSAAVEHALKVEKEKGGFNYGDAERIGKERGCSGASVWQWRQKAKGLPSAGTGAKVSRKPFTQPPAEKKTPDKSEYITMLEGLIEKYKQDQIIAAAKVESLRMVLQDLAA